MAGTSGGGFALMIEGLSLAGMTETPVVVVDAQRPSPATGFPTRTEQADLDFVIHGSHGEYAKAVFSPGTVEECFRLTVKAFNLAEKYQIPVIILTDQHLAESPRNIKRFDLDETLVERFIISKEESSAVEDYRRYQLTSSGISPRAIPSWIRDVIYADSDEHTEEGHITEKAGIRTEMVQKRLHKKMVGLAAEVESPVACNVAEAKTVLIGFGSTYGVLKEACELLREQGVGHIHLPQVWPFPADNLSELLKGARSVRTVENNATGQLARLLRRETGISVDGSILKYDGRPFDIDFLVSAVEKEL
jgi:2-oxoglutarate ferredoxin oxidoreductase subunit alpha